MKYKKGVVIKGTVFDGTKFVESEASSNLKFGMNKFDEKSKYLTGKEAVVTSVLEGNHRAYIHPTGNAADFRIWIYTEDEIQAILCSLKREMPKAYTLILEKDHFHLQYKPV